MVLLLAVGCAASPAKTPARGKCDAGAAGCEAKSGTGGASGAQLGATRATHTRFDAGHVASDAGSQSKDAGQASNVHGYRPPDAGGMPPSAGAKSTPDAGSAANDACGVGLAPPEDGFQVCTQGFPIAPGEFEYCEVVVLPGDASDVYYAGEFETKTTPFLHHLIVLAAEPGSANEARMQKVTRVLCIGGEQAFGQGLTGVIGAQQTYRDEAYPAGVGKVFHGGQRLSFDYHYFNTTTAPIPARAALNIHRVAQIKHVAHGFGFYNFGIDVPPGESQSFMTGCTFSADIVVYSLVRHTHRWGTDFTVWWEGGPNDGERLWRSTDWELDTEKILSEDGQLMKAGTGFRFECSYTNTTDYPLRFGITAADEMCILFGTFWNLDESHPAASQDCRVGLPGLGSPP